MAPSNEGLRINPLTAVVVATSEFEDSDPALGVMVADTGYMKPCDEVSIASWPTNTRLSSLPKKAVLFVLVTMNCTSCGSIACWTMAISNASAWSFPTPSSGCNTSSSSVHGLCNHTSLPTNPRNGAATHQADEDFFLQDAKHENRCSFEKEKIWMFQSSSRYVYVTYSSQDIDQHERYYD
jgi:hypothetical protein